MIVGAGVTGTDGGGFVERKTITAAITTMVPRASSAAIAMAIHFEMFVVGFAAREEGGTGTAGETVFGEGGGGGGRVGVADGPVSLSPVRGKERSAFIEFLSCSR